MISIKIRVNGHNRIIYNKMMRKMTITQDFKPIIHNRF